MQNCPFDSAAVKNSCSVSLGMMACAICGLDTELMKAAEGATEARPVYGTEFEGGRTAVAVVDTDATAVDGTDAPTVVDTNGGTEGPAVGRDAAAVEAAGMKPVVESRVDVMVVRGTLVATTDVVVVNGSVVEGM